MTVRNSTDTGDDPIKAGDTVAHSTEVKFACEDGYKKDGSTVDKIMCTTDLEFPDVPTCVGK